MRNSYKVINNVQKTENTFCLRIERPNYTIKSGQCFNIGISGLDINREYSIYSGAEDPYLEFLVRKIDNGLVSSMLQNLKNGDVVEIDGPYGEFCISEKDFNKKFIFIASGTGVAPFHSFVKTFNQIDYTLIHGIRYFEEMYDIEDYGEYRYTPCISQNINGRSIRVPEYLLENPISLDSYVYLCGNRNMIINVVQNLLNSGFSGSQIISEVFF